MKSLVAKRSIVAAGHKTSVLEDAFWEGLKEIARGRNITLSELVAAIDSGRRQGNLSSAIRLFDRTLRYMMPDFTIALTIGLVIGFILGYGLRAIISYRRHQRARRRSLPLLSLVCRTARPAAVPHGPKDCGDLPPLAVLKQYSDGVATTRERPTATYRCTRTRRSRLPSRPSVERWRCQFWADCTTNISERNSDNLCDFCNAAEFF